VLVSCGVGCLLLLAGCDHVNPRLIPNYENTHGGGGKKEVVTAEMLVKYLNQNSERLKTVTCLDVRLVAYVGLTGVLHFQLDGKMTAQQPRHFRVMAKMAGSKPAVDLGSNDQEFWYWFSQGPQYLFFCTHQNLALGNIKQGDLLPPFQPEWIMETLGMSE